MSARDLIKILTDAGFDPSSIKIQDAAYVLPTKAWILGEFAGAFETLKNNLGANGYVPQINDCDDFALLAQWYIGHLHRITSASRQSGIAFGSIAYMRDSGGGHAINIAVVDRGEVVFFEPQNSKQVNLSDEEIFLCSDIRI